MTPADAAVALLKSLNLPDGSANVLTWHEGPVSLRIWVDERYFWHVKKNAPAIFEGLTVEVEIRPEVKAQMRSMQ